MNVATPSRLISWITVLLILVTAPFTSLSAAEDNEDSGIVFLHLRINGNNVSLVDTRTVSGHLKLPRGGQSQGDLIYELVDEQAEVRYSAVMDDPLTLKFDYEDPDQPGRLRSKVVHLEQTEFTVRVPAVSGATRVNFYKVERTPGASPQAATRTLIGSISLTSGGEAEQ